MAGLVVSCALFFASRKGGKGYDKDCGNVAGLAGR